LQDEINRYKRKGHRMENENSDKKSEIDQASQLLHEAARLRKIKSKISTSY